jgi:hypothetical protein
MTAWSSEREREEIVPEKPFLLKPPFTIHRSNHKMPDFLLCVVFLLLPFPSLYYQYILHKRKEEA